MKKTASIILIPALFLSQAFAQLDSVLYGIARNTSGQLYLAKANTVTGQVTNISDSVLSFGIAMDGLAALDPYRNIFYLFSNGLMGIDLATGNVVSTTFITVPSPQKYFNLMQFNCRDSTLYGVTRNINGIWLAKINLDSGMVTNISSSPFAPGYTLNSLATLDPYRNVFYMQYFGKLFGVDLTSGIVVTDTFLTIPSPQKYFDLMQFNCKDSTIYGVTRNINGIWLAKVDVSTGIVTNISTAPFTSGISLNALATIDPYLNIFYVQTFGGLLGVDLTTGNMVTAAAINNPVPTLSYFDLMRFNSSACNNPVPKSISGPAGKLHVFPNPFHQNFNIDFDNPGKEEFSLLIYNSFGQLALSIDKITSSQVQVEKGNLPGGIYIFQLLKDKQIVSTVRVLVIE